MTPAFLILADGVDVTGNFNDRLISLSVTDNEGSKSDSCEIEVDDRDGQLQIPRKGTKLSISMGYKETGLSFMGLYVVDEVEVSGLPRRMRISASAADLRDKLKSQISGGYENKTLKDVVGAVAKRHGLTPQISTSLGSFTYDYLGQTDESDLHLLSRVAADHDAIFKFANGKLLFMKRGELLSASGRTLAAVLIRADQVLDYSGKFKDKPQHEKSAASYWDSDAAERVTEEEALEDPDSDGHDTAPVTDSGPHAAAKFASPDHPSGPHSAAVYATPGAHVGKDRAKARARSKAAALQRDTRTLELTIIGNTGIMAEMQIKVSGVRVKIDDLWRIKTAVHSVGQDGYRTQITAERPK